MKKVTDYSVGRRWRSHDRPGKHAIEFSIIGPGETYDGDPDSSSKKCRITADDHNHYSMCSCGHGIEQFYKHKHLKKYATLLPIDAPEQDAVKTIEK